MSGIHDVCADSGATEDVLNCRYGVGANNKRQVDDITLMGWEVRLR